MAQIIIEAQERSELGKNANRRLRNAGMIPGVIYGSGEEARALSVDPKEIVQILRSDSGQNTIFKLKLPGGTSDVLIRDYQVHPLRGNLMHADFQAIQMDEVRLFEVPLEPRGESLGVKAGGMLDMVLRTVEVECLPGDVPEHLSLDVSELEIGDTLRVSNIEMEDEKVKLLSDPELVVLHIAAPIAEEEDEEVEEELDQEEPEVIAKGKAEEEEEE